MLVADCVANGEADCDEDNLLDRQLDVDVDDDDDDDDDDVC